MFSITICSGLNFVLHLCGGGRVFSYLFSSFFFSCVPFHLYVVNFLLTLSRLCLGWWPKEPAGLKTLRLVSMPSWRRANSEEQEEEDDDDVVGPPGTPASQTALQGHQRVWGSLGPQVAHLPIAFFPVHLGIWVPKKVVKTNCASCHC